MIVRYEVVHQTDPRYHIHDTVARRSDVEAAFVKRALYVEEYHYRPNIEEEVVVYKAEYNDFGVVMRRELVAHP